MFRELSGLARIVASSHRLDRALAAADVPAQAKRALLDDVTKHSINGAALDAAVNAISSSQSRAAESLAEAALNAALDESDLTSIESSLHAISSLIESNGQLRQALSDVAVDDDAKVTLLRDVLTGKADPSAVELVCTFVFLDHGRRVARRAIEAAQQAAQRNNRLMADVTTAIELDDQRRQAITRALEANYDRSVEARFTVDPSILGSVVVSVNEEVLDGSLRHRLEQAKKAVTS